MAYKVIILYQLYMPSYFLGTFTEYPEHEHRRRISNRTNLHYLRPSSRQYTSLRITSSTFSLLLTSRPYSSTCTVPPIETAGLR